MLVFGLLAALISAATAMGQVDGLAFAAQLEAVRAGAPEPVTGEQTNASGSRPRRARERSVLGVWR